VSAFKNVLKALGLLIGLILIGLGALALFETVFKSDDYSSGDWLFVLFLGVFSAWIGVIIVVATGEHWYKKYLAGHPAVRRRNRD
jgi:uncharacterized membrane protein HdeD (DUF308 family)